MVSILRRLLFLFVLSLLINTCGNERDIRNFYFPVRELTDGLVYEYRDIRYDSLSPDYWYYRTIPTDSAYYFTKAYYQNDFIQRQLYREAMVENGMLIKDLFLYESDSTDQQLKTRAEILSPNVFPFEVMGNQDIYIYQVRFQLPSQPHGSTTVLINRRFIGDTTYQFQDQTYSAIQFEVLGSVDQRDSILGDIEPHFNGREIYAERLGLVYYERSYGKDVPAFKHQLINRYPMNELAERARQEWGIKIQRFQ